MGARQNGKRAEATVRASRYFDEQMWTLVQGAVDAANVGGLVNAPSLPAWSSLSDHQREVWGSHPLYIRACASLGVLSQIVLEHR